MASVTDARTGIPAAQVRITLYATMLDMAMGTDSITLHADASGQFSASSNHLNMGGRWALGITIETADHTIHKAGVIIVLAS